VKEGNNQEDRDIDGRIVLKYIFKEVAYPCVDALSGLLCALNLTFGFTECGRFVE
jgi:hypothetical protein